MTKRKKTQRPSPLQQRYYRAGLNAGAAMASDEVRAELERAIEQLLTRLRTRGVAFTTPLLSATHPMAAWSPRKKRGR